MSTELWGDFGPKTFKHLPKLFISFPYKSSCGRKSLLSQGALKWWKPEPQKWCWNCDGSLVGSCPDGGEELSDMNELLSPLWNAPCYLWWGHRCPLNFPKSAQNLLCFLKGHSLFTDHSLKSFNWELVETDFSSKSRFCDWLPVCRIKEQLWPVATCPADSTVTSAAPWNSGLLWGADPGRYQQVHSQRLTPARSPFFCPSVSTRKEAFGGSCQSFR